jgi:hypothetical protein
MSISGISSNGSIYQASFDGLTQLTQQLQSLSKTHHPCDPSIGQLFLAQLQSIGVLPDSPTQSGSNSNQSNATPNPATTSTDSLAQLTQQLQSLSNTHHPCDPSIVQQFFDQLQSIGVVPDSPTQSGSNSNQSGGSTDYFQALVPSA